MNYQYKCRTCEQITDAIRSVADRDSCPTCECGGETRKIISLYAAHSDLTPYYDEHLQTHIQGKQHRARVMKEQGVSEYFGGGWHTSARKNRR